MRRSAVSSAPTRRGCTTFDDTAAVAGLRVLRRVLLGVRPTAPVGDPAVRPLPSVPALAEPGVPILLLLRTVAGGGVRTGPPLHVHGGDAVLPPVLRRQDPDAL